STTFFFSFFFSSRRRHTRSYGDWSSDVCSSDLTVVFCNPLRARGRAGLDLPAAAGDGEVGDEGVLGLARAVRHHRAKAGAPRQRSEERRVGKEGRARWAGEE